MKTKYSFWLTKPKCWLHDAVSIWSHIMIWAMVRILFIEWPIIKREFAICKFVSFFHSCKTWVAMCTSPLFPSNKVIWLSDLCYLQICQRFLSCKLGGLHVPLFSCSPTHIHFFGSHKRYDLILTTALAVLNWLKLSFAYHLHKDQNTPKKNSSRNQSSVLNH
jgi:hypothetical protein